MHTSRKTLLKHFDARAAEYNVDMSRNSINEKQTKNESSEKPVHPTAFPKLYLTNQVAEPS
jgi:hypothetical protein